LQMPPRALGAVKPLGNGAVFGARSVEGGPGASKHKKISYV